MTFTRDELDLIETVFTNLAEAARPSADKGVTKHHQGVRMRHYPIEVPLTVPDELRLNDIIQKARSACRG